MYKRMLVPLDGSELAESVIPYARELASKLGIEMVCFHVCPSGQSPSSLVCRSYVDAVADAARQSRVNARGDTATGYPAEEIINYAEHNQVDFILMSAHGSSGATRWAIGSVADKVIQASKVPVCLIRPDKLDPANWLKRAILVPLDGSVAAECVFPHVTELARLQPPGLNNLVLLRVCEPPDLLADYPEAIMPHAWNEHVKEATVATKQVCGQYLASAERRFAEESLTVHPEELLGDPAEEIIKYTNENPVGMIVMSTHGRSALARWAYGDVAGKVLHSVTCPVFLVKPR